MVVVSVIPFFQRVGFFPFQSRRGVFPLLTPRAGFRHQIPRIFLFPPCTNVGSQEGIFFWLLSLGFWFCNFFGNRDEEGQWEGARVCVEGRMGRDAKPTNLLCLCPFLSRKVNQKSRGERWSQSPGKIRSFSPSLSSRLLSNNCYF